MARFEKVCLITKETPLQGLKRRYGTKDQARFVLERQQVAFDSYETFDRTYESVVKRFTASLPAGVRVSVIDLAFLPTYQFDPSAVVVTVGPDGLVANTAKYLENQPLVAINPDPRSIDGVLAKNSLTDALNLINGQAKPIEKAMSMAEAILSDGQSLLAVNDLFIGQRTHVSALYEIEFGHIHEQQSSSGVIVSTGAGSTGWRKSVITGAAGLLANQNGREEDAADYAFPSDARQLVFAVREPFISRASKASLITGTITDGRPLTLTSRMPQNGVIFSDGIEADYLEFNSGAIASIGLAKRTVNLWSAR